MVGAYPSHEAYEKIRGAIEKIKSDNKNTGFSYPVTTEVHVPRDTDESKHAFWTEGDSPTGQFIIAFARWVESARLSTGEDAKGFFEESISKSIAPMEVSRCGLIKGGLWDIYCIMDLKDVLPIEPKQRKQLFKKMWGVLRQRSIQGVTFKYCDNLPD
jgi:hypothetical protein